MDNVITGENSLKKAMTFYHEAKLIFQNASIILREWISNSEDFLSKKNLKLIESKKRMSKFWVCAGTLTVIHLP